MRVFYYNGKIYGESEYRKGIVEEEEVTWGMNVKDGVSFVGGNYEKDGL